MKYFIIDNGQDYDDWGVDGILITQDNFIFRSAIVEYLISRRNYLTFYKVLVKDKNFSRYGDNSFVLLNDFRISTHNGENLEWYKNSFWGGGNTLEKLEFKNSDELYRVARDFITLNCRVDFITFCEERYNTQYINDLIEDY